MFCRRRSSLPVPVTLKRFATDLRVFALPPTLAIEGGSIVVFLQGAKIFSFNFADFLSKGFGDIPEVSVIQNENFLGYVKN